MAEPVLDLAGDPQRLRAAVGGGDVAGEFLVGEVRVVLERAGRLDGIDAAAGFAFGELGAPGRRLQSRGEVDVLEAALDEIAAETGADQVADGEVGPGAVVEGGPGGTSRAYISAFPQNVGGAMTENRGSSSS